MGDEARFSKDEAIQGVNAFLKEYHKRLPDDMSDFLEEGLVSFWQENAKELKDGVKEKDADEIFDLLVTLGLAMPDNSGGYGSCPTWDNARAVRLGEGAGMMVALLSLNLPPAIAKKHPKELSGGFANPERGVVFKYEENTDKIIALTAAGADKRFLSLFVKLAEAKLPLILSGVTREELFYVSGVRIADGESSTKDGMTNELLRLMVDRLLTAPIRKQPLKEQEISEPFADIKMIKNFLDCAGATLPLGIEQWARRTIYTCEHSEISADERRHAKRALGMTLNIRWMDTRFDDIDPYAARHILDEELYGMEEVKQRVIETIIQINRTHTLPSYGLLLSGPAGTGKSQISYAVARILRIPWAVLDMSTVKDAEALTGTPRIYSNAKPGRVMEAFARAGTSNIVFVINELDKANHDSQNGNPADVLLTLLDNLGFTDNYVECAIPTGGVYPIATANDKNEISAPLLSRFTVIDIPAYTMDEKKVIFQRYSLPNALARMGMRRDECVVTGETVD